MKNDKNRESELLGEPANILRLPYITKMLDCLHLKKVREF